MLASTSASHACGSIPLSLADRKSTRLNSSHSQISYAVFCLKKKNDRLAPPVATAPRMRGGGVRGAAARAPHAAAGEGAAAAGALERLPTSPEDPAQLTPPAR